MSALSAAGVSLSVLDGADAASVLGRSLDPAGPPRPGGLPGAAHDEPVTLARRAPTTASFGDPSQKGATR